MADALGFIREIPIPDDSMLEVPEKFRCFTSMELYRAAMYRGIAEYTTDGKTTAHELIKDSIRNGKLKSTMMIVFPRGYRVPEGAKKFSSKELYMFARIIDLEELAADYPTSDVFTEKGRNGYGWKQLYESWKNVARTKWESCSVDTFLSISEETPRIFRDPEYWSNVGGWAILDNIRFYFQKYPDVLGDLLKIGDISEGYYQGQLKWLDELKARCKERDFNIDAEINMIELEKYWKHGIPVENDKAS